MSGDREKKEQWPFITPFQPKVLLKGRGEEGDRKEERFPEELYMFQRDGEEFRPPK